MKTSLCLLTKNAYPMAHKFVKALDSQQYKADSILVIDSDSDDGSTAIFREAGADIHVISRSSFNHGATRQLAVDLSRDAEIIIFMTQDAILAHSDSLRNLLACFADENIGVAYGRQLPNEDASPIAAHAREFNYPKYSQSKSVDDACVLGIKTAFTSNSFAAYRRSALTSVGGFPSDAILSEDMYVAAKMLIAGWKIVYSSEACVYHSHNYSIMQEFSRYFDQGVFHSRESWIREAFGNAEGEGKKFVISELKYLLRSSPWRIPSAMLRTLCKYLGYNLGFNEQRLPLVIKAKMSMNKGFWSKQKPA
jgi:rhamnosyltransferase